MTVSESKTVTAHEIFNRNGEEIMQIFVDADAVDYKLISICHKGDIVVSQDYGVSAMALGKGLTRTI